jgi:hypothetical protein
MVPEGRKCPTVCRHCVICEIAGNDLPQPLSLRRKRLMHALSQLSLDFLKLCLHAVATRFPFDEEMTSP